MDTRISQRADLPELTRLARSLWPDADESELNETFGALLSDSGAAFLLEADGKAVGFAQCQLRRDYVEGTASSPVGYLEGIWVDPEYRRQGGARALLRSCEAWARAQGCVEFASDCELANVESLRFHRAVGFAEANRIICFTKRL